MDLTQDLIAKLSNLTPEELKAATEQATALRGKTLRDRVPEDVVKRMKALSDLYATGQTVVVEFSLPIKLTAKFNATYGYGHLEDWNIELNSGTKTGIAKDFFEEIQPAIQDHFCEHSDALEHMVPDSAKICERETENRRNFDEARRGFEATYGFDPTPLLEDK